MAKLKIAIVISTTRAARFGHKPAQWVHGIAAARDDIETEIIDLRDFPMPFFDEVASNAWVPSQNPVAQRWQKKVAEFDGFIFVTAEYNHGIPAALKNALDYAYPEWVKKAPGLSATARSAARARSSNCVWWRPNCKWQPSALVSISRAPTSWRCGRTART
jgi:NAD(P)H-dependent FMN reductase